MEKEEEREGMRWGWTRRGEGRQEMGERGAKEEGGEGRGAKWVFLNFFGLNSGKDVTLRTCKKSKVVYFRKINKGGKF